MQDDEDLIAINKTSYTTPEFIINKDIKYTAALRYEAGAVKKNNFNEDDYVDFIHASVLKDSVIVKEYRSYFAFTLNYEAAITPELIRSNKIKGLNLKKNDSISLDVSKESRIICFAYPTNLGECNSIEYETLKDDCKNIFTKEVMQIPDANNKNPIIYNVYYLNIPISFGNISKFILNI